MEETSPKTFKEIVEEFLDELNQALESEDLPSEIHCQLDDILIDLESIVEFL